MGTKLNPGKFDCYAAAKDDEPMFILLARDELAPSLVEMWGHLRRKNFPAANACFETAIALANEASVKSTEKSCEAVSCSIEMIVWKDANGSV